ncbi:catecholate siderophore receptor Fiu [Acinetobacter sp. MD2(2019)]|uniref:catecholate siderophore receptor Fiu n=1 Tax=Acinetobacter sp. MD2(2019) TaxID=2605273 RepID=UPI002D1F627E|nr:catecholate siderophore receptor Fiu [Acinetobacter sp. MD2(2019)]MEB3754634.1 catecholate siderophore receptor Fiu [Acinetobacter sp. MD2(2019)]
MSLIKTRKKIVSSAIASSLSIFATTTFADEVAQLPTIHAQATKDNSYKADQVSNTKFTQPLVNTTQTISVVKKEVLADQNATTLTEALKNIPGVGAFAIGENGAMNTGDAVSIRGLDVQNSIFVDGLRDINTATRDVFNTEQVEVYKGASGTDNGRTAATGSINMVSKKANLNNATSGTLGFGSDSFYRATADVNQKINDTTAIRLNAMGENSDGIGRDVVENKKWGVAGSLGLGLGTDTRAYINYMHVEQNNIPDGGVSTVGLPGFNASNSANYAAAQSAYLNNNKVNPSNFYGSSSDFDDAQSDLATIMIEHDLSDKTTLSSSTRWGRNSHKYLATIPFSIVPNTAMTSDNAQMNRLANSGDSSNTLLSNQTNLQTKFNTGSIEHDLSTGFEVTQEKSNVNGLTAGTIPTVSLYQPNHSDPVSLTRNPDSWSVGQVDTYSAYIFDTVKLLPNLHINGGIRADNYHLKSDGSANIAGRGQPATYQAFHYKDSGTLLNWKAGILFKPTEQGSLYANYSIQQQAPGTLAGGDGLESGNPFAPSTQGNNANNLDLKPQKAKNAEVGVKWEFFDERLLLTGAYFYTELTNQLENIGSTSTPLYVQSGKKTIQGVELGAVGNLTEHWQITTGYTHQDTKLKNVTQATGTASTSADGSDVMPFTPGDAFTFWSTYKTDKWSIGAGTRYTGEMKKATDGNKVGPAVIDDYWVADAMASYQLTKNIGLQFNINNIFDKDYVASMNRGGWRYFPGAERNYRATINFKF